MEVAPCKPFSNMVDTAEIITCSFLVDSMVIIEEVQNKTGNWNGHQNVLNDSDNLLGFVFSILWLGNGITDLSCCINIDKLTSVSHTEHLLDGSGLQHSFAAPEHHFSSEASQVLPQDGDRGCLWWVSGHACSSLLCLFLDFMHIKKCFLIFWCRWLQDLLLFAKNHQEKLNFLTFTLMLV